LPPVSSVLTNEYVNHTNQFLFPPSKAQLALRARFYETRLRYKTFRDNFGTEFHKNPTKALVAVNGHRHVYGRVEVASLQDVLLLRLA